MIAGSYGNTVFCFVRNGQTVFESGCNVLNSHQWWMRVFIAPHPCQRLVVQCYGFWHFSRYVAISHCYYNLKFPNDMWCQMPSHMFTCHCVSSDEVAVQAYTHFLTRLFIFFLLSLRVVCVFWITVLYLWLVF